VEDEDRVQLLFSRKRADALIVVCGGPADARRPERKDDAREIE
jgi:hypothetical protein